MLITPINTQRYNKINFNKHQNFNVYSQQSFKTPAITQTKSNWYLLGQQKLISFGNKISVNNVEKVKTDTLKTHKTPGLIADLLVTHSCNMHCPHCVDDFVNKSDEIVSLDKVDEFFTLLKNEVTDKWEKNYGEKPKIEIMLLGGEPTMAGAEHLNKIAELAHKNDFDILISTNGKNKEVISKIVPNFDWVQLTCRTDEEIDFWRPFKDKINIKLPGDESLTFEKFKHFEEYAKDFGRRSLIMYFDSDYNETCKDEKMWDYLNGLDWEQKGNYLLAYTQNGTRIKRRFHGVPDATTSPLYPKLHPNGNYNTTWSNDELDLNLPNNIFINIEKRFEDNSELE